MIRAAVGVGDAVLGAMLEQRLRLGDRGRGGRRGLPDRDQARREILDLPAASGPDAEQFARGTAPSWTVRTLAPGELYHSDMYGSFHGYFFDFGRTTVVETEPDVRQRALIDGAIAAVDAGIDALRPGATFGHAYAAAAAELTGTELQVSFPSFGHGLGLGIESPWLTPDSPDPLSRTCISPSRRS